MPRAVILIIRPSVNAYAGISGSAPVPPAPSGLIVAVAAVTRAVPLAICQGAPLFSRFIHV
jgi:hypothetical protein